MNILFACHRVPFPPNRGGKIRPFHMLRHLARQHSVVLVSLAESEAELRESENLRDLCTEVAVEVVPRRVRWGQAWRALHTGTPSSVAYFRSARLHARVDHLVARRSFDLALVHCAFAAPYVQKARCTTQVLDFGDLDSAKWFDYSRCRPLPLSIGYRLEATKLRRFEQRCAAHFDRCTVTTTGELQEYRSLGVAVDGTVIPNGVTASFFEIEPDGDLDSNVLAFLGRMDYFPNIDGVLHFVRDVLPRVRVSVPGVQLRIIGANPDRRILELREAPGVTVTGSVPDVRPYLRDAALSIAPLRIARGTQNKILESMAMGLPVVATPIAAKGVQAVPGRDLLVAPEPATFASHIVALLQNPGLRAQLSAAGRRQVAEAHDWSRSMRILDGVLDAAASRRPARA
jgi:sugar transferase (PEP-CTERM/EpsH1 system associated)